MTTTSGRAVAARIPSEDIDGRPENLTWLETTYVAHYHELVGLARLWTGTDEAAEDVVQDTYIGVESRNGANVEAPLPYLRAAVANKARSTARRKGREREILRRLAFMAQKDSSDPTDLDEVIVLALRGLPARQRDVLILRFYLDWSTEQVAQELQITQDAVRASTYRGLEKLRLVASIGDNHERA